tara:strand:+ start:14066 stop:14530 length:465 start_codon:yes stop_codon:yes gene_type:complete
MNPIDTIKKGIINNDMGQIIQGFSVLTGEEVRPARGKPEQQGGSEPEPEKSGSKPHAEALQSPVQVRSKDLDFSTEPREVESRFGRKEPIQVGTNQFTDDGTEAKEVVTPDVPRTKRRPPVKLVEVTCHACGSTEKINPAYKSGSYHRCGRCVG